MKLLMQRCSPTRTRSLFCCLMSIPRRMMDDNFAITATSSKKTIDATIPVTIRNAVENGKCAVDDTLNVKVADTYMKRLLSLVYTCGQPVLKIPSRLTPLRLLTVRRSLSSPCPTLCTTRLIWLAISCSISRPWALP